MPGSSERLDQLVTRLEWLEEERDALFDILQQRLLAIDGRWSKIDCEFVDECNKLFVGKRQKGGHKQSRRRR